MFSTHSWSILVKNSEENINKEGGMLFMALMDDRAGIHNSSDHAHSAETLVYNVQHNNEIYVCSICIVLCTIFVWEHLWNLMHKDNKIYVN